MDMWRKWWECIKLLLNNCSGYIFSVRLELCAPNNVLMCAVNKLFHDAETAPRTMSVRYSFSSKDLRIHVQTHKKKKKNESRIFIQGMKKVFITHSGDNSRVTKYFSV